MASEHLLHLTLTDEEHAMLAGACGEAVRLAMRILVRVAPLYGARALLPITRAHIDGCIYEGDAGLEFAERLAALGGQVRVPTSLNVVSLDHARWQQLGQSHDFAEKARRLAAAYVAMGARPTFTCTPYQIDAAPAFGEQIAWAESNAVAYANSVIGARTNRYGDYLDICCALTGRAPASGLHLDENRRGEILLRLHGIPAALMERDDFYPVLGYLIGQLAGDRIPVIEGLTVQPTGDQLKALCAAAASSGAVALLHMAGITPEAPTVEHAFGGRQPVETHTIGMPELRAARSALTTARDGKVDAVAFGSPHCSLAECRHLARLMRGQRAAHGVEVWITTSRAVREILERTGELHVLEAFGAKVTADTCIVVAPLLGRGIRTLLTNSAKYAHYAPGLLGVQSIFGSTESCVEAAITGRVPPEDGLWS